MRPFNKKPLNLRKPIAQPKNLNHELPLKQVSKPKKDSHKLIKIKSVVTKINKISIDNESTAVPKILPVKLADIKFFSIDSKTCAQYAYLISQDEQSSSVSSNQKTQIQINNIKATALLDLMFIDDDSVRTSNNCQNTLLYSKNFNSHVAEKTNFTEDDIYSFIGDIGSIVSDDNQT